jgi:hypothetical protein
MQVLPYTIDTDVASNTVSNPLPLVLVLPVVEGFSAGNRL